MLAGWQWLALAILLFSLTLTAAFLGDTIAKQLFFPASLPVATSTQTALPTATFFPSPTHTSAPTETLTPEGRTTVSGTPPTFTRTFTVTPTQISTQTATVSPSLTSTATSTRTPRPTFTSPPTRTPRPSLTPSATRTLRPTITLTPTPSRTPSPTWTPLFEEIQVYFTDNKRLIAGQLPYEVAARRAVPSSKNRIEAVLDEFFKGPSDVERNSGLGLVLNGFTGYSKTTFSNGVVYVYLTGNCQSNGTLYSIAYPLMANLKQFPDVQYVKIFDQYGDTRQPAARVNSIPVCLDPTFTPSPTPSLTPTPR